MIMLYLVKQAILHFSDASQISVYNCTQFMLITQIIVALTPLKSCIIILCSLLMNNNDVTLSLDVNEKDNQNIILVI